MLGDSVRRRQPGRRTTLNAPAQGRRFPWKPLLIAVPVALLVSFGIGYLIAVRMLFPPPEVTGTGVPVPELVGRTDSEAQQALVSAGLGALEVAELPHPTAGPGQIFAQSPLPGQHLRTGASVRVAVSAGRPRSSVPDVQGFTAERADLMLRRAGFRTERAVQENPVDAGRVIRTEPGPGQELALPATVTLIVSSGPPPEPADTLPSDMVPPPDDS